jgi:bifunctional non-homologous end joining protein LigD
VAKRANRSSGVDGPIVAGVRITHPDKLMFPELGLTKLDIANYYASVGKWMLPHLKGRPLTLVFCPTGVSKGCTYLRHTKLWGPKAIRRVKIQEKTKLGEYMVVDTLEGLVSLAQMNVLEIHTWNSTIDRVEQPDRIVLDLDPGENVTWPQVIAAARQVRKILTSVDLHAWVKTTGGRGLHIVVPLIPERNWSKSLEFARAIASVMVEHNPSLYTTDFRKAGRERKILIDYLRNNRTNTSICAFSVRARDGAPVSMPIAWADLTPTLKPERFSVTSTAAYLARRRVDPWRDYSRSKQQLELPA